MKHSKSNIPDSENINIWEYNQYSLYSLFFNEPIEGNCVISSPFREDKNPSFSIYYGSKRGRVMWKDFGTQQYGDIIDFVFQFYLETTGEILSKSDCYQRLKEIIVNGTNPEIDLYTIPDYTSIASTVDIAYIPKEFSLEELNWWSSFGIYDKTLEHYGVKSVNKLGINGILRAISSKDNPIYAYPIGEYVKIYQPFNKKYKWRNNYPFNYVEGLVQLMRREKSTICPDTCIITKSLKDVMVLYEYGIDAIALKSESTMIKEPQLEMLTDRYKNVISFMDNDDAGQMMAYKLNEKYGLESIMLEENTGCKDISDFNKTNKIQCKQWIKKTIETTKTV